ncbi:MAG: hypothetical protein Q7S84_00880 [bacterium]|nr:hypothetical protein [bacterium]
MEKNEVYIQASFSVGDGWRFEHESSGWSVGPFQGVSQAEGWLRSVQHGEAPLIMVVKKNMPKRLPAGKVISGATSPTLFRELLSEEVRPAFHEQFG